MIARHRCRSNLLFDDFIAELVDVDRRGICAFEEVLEDGLKLIDRGGRILLLLTVMLSEKPKSVRTEQIKLLKITLRLIALLLVVVVLLRLIDGGVDAAGG